EHPVALRLLELLEPAEQFLRLVEAVFLQVEQPQLQAVADTADVRRLAAPRAEGLIDQQPQRPLALVGQEDRLHPAWVGGAGPVHCPAAAAPGAFRARRTAPRRGPPGGGSGAPRRRASRGAWVLSGSGRGTSRR